MCDYCHGSSQATHSGNAVVLLPQGPGLPSCCCYRQPCHLCHIPSPPLCQAQGQLSGRSWLAMACVGHRDGKVEQEEGKGMKKRSTLSQNQVSISILSVQQPLGKVTHFHAGGICLNVEEKSGLSIKSRYLVYLIPMN